MRVEHICQSKDRVGLVILSICVLSRVLYISAFPGCEPISCVAFAQWEVAG